MSHAHAAPPPASENRARESAYRVIDAFESETREMLAELDRSGATDSEKIGAIMANAAHVCGHVIAKAELSVISVSVSNEAAEAGVRRARAYLERTIRHLRDFTKEQVALQLAKEQGDG